MTLGEPEPLPACPALAPLMTAAVGGFVPFTSLYRSFVITQPLPTLFIQVYLWSLSPRPGPGQGCSEDLWGAFADAWCMPVVL